MSAPDRPREVHLALIERACEASLLRDLAIINARVRRELGAACVGGATAEPERKSKSTQNFTSVSANEPALSANEQGYGDDASMKPHRIAAATLAASAALSACGAPTAPSSEHPVPSKPGIADEATAIASKSSAPSPERIDAIIKQVLDQQYGNSFSADLNCWKYAIEAQGQQYHYCMAYRAHRLVHTEQGNKLYILASNRSDIRQLSQYQYTHLDTGLMGAFEVRLDADSQWSLLASSKDMDYGTMGYCGCDDAKFVKLGKNHHGWLFSSGGVWQGIAALQYSIVAPRNSRFADLSDIPLQTEDDQDSEYKIEIDDSLPDQSMYPLLVTKLSHGKKIATTKVNFDVKREKYSLPRAD